MDGDAAPVQRQWFSVSGQFGWYFPVWWGGFLEGGAGNRCNNMSVKEKMDRQHWVLSLSERRSRFHWRRGSDRGRNPTQEVVPQVKLRGKSTLSTQHIPLSADGEREWRCHARNPKHPSAFPAVPMLGEEKWVEEGRQRELQQECSYSKMSVTIFRCHFVTFSSPNSQ